MKQMTVTGVTLLYRGANEYEEQKYAEPYAVVYVSFDYGTTNVSGACECPL